MRATAARLASAAAAKARPTLRGVVFDVDGTLTRPNIDFAAMYRRVGVDPAHDILAAVAAKPPTERKAAEAIIEHMESESRDSLELMPGAANVVAWLHARGVRTAVVTRNTKLTIDKVTSLLAAEEMIHSPCFDPAVSRDHSLPSKPDPASLRFIAEAWGIDVDASADAPRSSGLVMIGDSPTNDVAFGKAASALTVLLDTGRRHVEGGSDGGADFVVSGLDEIPAILAEHFADVAELEHYDKPEPTTEAARAAAANDVDALRRLHAAGSLSDKCESGNTPLIWAAEHGNLEATEFLLSVASAEEANSRGYLGATAVNRAARRGEHAVLRALLSDARTRPSVDAHNDKSQTPLHFAAFKRNPLCVRELLIAGANTKVRDRKGRTPDEDTDVPEIREAIRSVRAGADPTKVLQG